MSAVLAIWNDCHPGRESAFEAWYREEHLIERMGIGGFEVGRRYIALDAVQTYMTTYEVEAVEVLQSPDYRARLENPTPRTRAIMQEGFETMSRTVCRRTRLEGAVRGVFVVTVAWMEQADPDPLIADVRSFEGVLHSELWESAESAGASASAEEALRGGDDKIDACLLVEFSDEVNARALLARMREAAPSAAVGLYMMICELRGTAL